MRKYGVVFWLAAQDLFEYRFDFIASTTKYALMVIMMTLIWTGVSQESVSLPMTSQETVRYFFFSAMLFSLSNFHTNYIEDDIRLGNLNKFLLKPLSAFGYYFTFESASASIETLLKIVVMVPLLWVMGFGFSIEPTHLALGISFFPLIFTFAFTFFSLISGLAFWITEAYAIRWAVTILLRFVAGTLLPINFLPLGLQQVMYWLPFQHLAYTPIQVLQNQLSLELGVLAWFVLLCWTMVFLFLRHLLWKAGAKQFEGAGI